MCISKGKNKVSLSLGTYYKPFQHKCLVASASKSIHDFGGSLMLIFPYITMIKDCQAVTSVEAQPYN